MISQSALVEDRDWVRQQDSGHPTRSYVRIQGIAFFTYLGCWRQCALDLLLCYWRRLGASFFMNVNLFFLHFLVRGEAVVWCFLLS